MPDLLSVPRAPDGIQAPVVISPLCLLLQPACLPPPPVARFRNIWWFTCSTHHLPDASQAVATARTSRARPTTTQRRRRRHRNHQEYLDKIVVERMTADENAEGFLSSAQCFCRCRLVDICQLIYKCLVITMGGQQFGRGESIFPLRCMVFPASQVEISKLHFGQHCDVPVTSLH